MSFGAAAHGRPAIAPEAPCPCGGGEYAACCGPLLGGAPAPTAERLMRSRFTAFALRDTRHLERTWHPTTAPAQFRLEADDEAPEWTRLEIVRVDGGVVGDTAGVVEFRAHWRDRASGERGVLHEVSRFRFAGGRWFYVDGDVRD